MTVSIFAEKKIADQNPVLYHRLNRKRKINDKIKHDK